MTGNDAARISAMVRSALMVADLDRSTAFYRDILGLSDIYGQGELSHPAGAKLIGMPPDTKIRYRILKAPGPSRGMVGLFEITNPAPPPVRKRRDGVNIGEAVLVFYCSDLAAVHKKLADGGHDILCPPTHLQATAAKGQPEMTFLDPDGIIVNLIQRDPDSTV